LVIKRLYLRNFRNYTETELLFSPGYNLVEGRNGRGKSNLVEAVFLLSTSRSYRSDPDRQLVRWGEDGYLVRGLFDREGEEYELGLAFDGKNKQLYVNGNREERVSSIIGYVFSVLFSQEDSFLIKGPPSRRRGFLDLVLSTVDPLYFARLRTYLKLVRHKNSVLRTGAPRADVLEVWNEQLAENGSAIMCRRRRFLAFADCTVRELAARLGCSGGARLSYTPSVPFPPEQPSAQQPPSSGEGGEDDLKQSFLEELRRREARELRLGQAVVGPHRDDFSLVLEGVDLHAFGSAGQARMGSILLRMTQEAYYRKTKGISSILILDDVLPELDGKNRERVLGLIEPGSQLIVTATARNQVPERIPVDRVLCLDEERGIAGAPRPGDGE
jgi:DNA replication and repair protein RecF